MTATAAEILSRARNARRARTGGPDNGPKLLEHILGWTLVVVLAMFVTQAGLM
ncbi:SCO1431 family membrane protein [Streptomyces sp. NPDC005899]|uniref:SCO1431 family membrane protein n=1 Tax=Streptomyces sp. NPDC005899 TaxID=3155716 RepID=UPI003403E010